MSQPTHPSFTNPPSPTTLPSWAVLQHLYDTQKDTPALTLSHLFASDPDRFTKLSITLSSSTSTPNEEGGLELLVDFSKHLINDSVLEALLSLAKEAGIEPHRTAMFSGAHINTTEDRAVLHVALRAPPHYTLPNTLPDGTPLGGTEPGVSEVQGVLMHIESFTRDVRSGRWTGYTGERIDTIVNIGIGGSDLGPRMVVDALRPYTRHEGEGERELKTYFVSNVDGTHIAETLRTLNGPSTLFIIASKTFTTQETMENARTAREWFLGLPGASSSTGAIAKHFVAVSTNEKAVEEFGISKTNMFGFWDWVGGRYSLFSSIGLSISLSLSFPIFSRLLSGAHTLDQHFLTAPLSQNIPVLLGLLGVWYTGFWGSQSTAVLPYDEYLGGLAEYLQQADMESNGKGVRRGGEGVRVDSGPILWGAAGTNGQHSFYQLLHQGTRLVPADFLAPCTSHNAPRASNPALHHRILLSNFFAQTEALAFGKSESEVRKELNLPEGGVYATEEERVRKEALVKSKVFKGNRPSTSVMFPKMTPEVLGALIAMYEHKIFVQGVVWGINSFDQMGVELGKVLAKNIQGQLERPEDVKGHDSSTTGLIHYYQKNRKE